MKATYCEVNTAAEGEDPVIKGIEIFKDPVTDDGTKKSAKGLLRVEKVEDKLVLVDQVTPEAEEQGLLEPIYKDGTFMNQVTFKEVRELAQSTI